MVDFVRLANTAKRLIDENGRSITINQKSSVSIDTNRPWGRAVTTNIDTLTTIALEASAMGSRAGGRKSFITEELLRQDQKSFLVNAVDAGIKDLTVFDEIVDNEENYVVERVDIFQPGTVILLYEFVVIK